MNVKLIMEGIGIVVAVLKIVVQLEGQGKKGK